LDIEG